ncbi:rCG52353 [Rattus norvegicus]|uniref:RCG52353 n=1 Tax=Rattus norvegicus TaxID=10116 RepID=A6K0Y3_RAT|nr:rCG52353 [Rattus norvegicus]
MPSALKDERREGHLAAEKTGMQSGRKLPASEQARLCQGAPTSASLHLSMGLLLWLTFVQKCKELWIDAVNAVIDAVNEAMLSSRTR